MKSQMKNNWKKLIGFTLILLTVIVIFSVCANAEPGISLTEDGIKIGSAENPEDTANSIQILLLLTVLSLAPSILIMMTAFTRIIIILSFLRNALGTQQMPPNQVLIGLALFLTLFVMTPVIDEIKQDAYQPFVAGTISQEQAIDKSTGAIKRFMLKQFRDDNKKDLALFMRLGNVPTPSEPEELPLTVIVPAFLVNELTVAFKFGFILYIPFLVIDMVVSSTLMSMGMMMLPPVMISLPFKILLFIMVDGWSLVIQSMMGGFVT